MLQNRIDLFGNIMKTEARGAWMGNRGHLHDENQNVLRSFKLKAWLIYELEFRRRKRQVMAPNRYTKLFLWTKQPHLPLVTAHVLNAGEVIITFLNSIG
jgi:hypothetical protein